MHIALVASIRLVLVVVLLWNIIFAAADVVGRCENIIVQIVSLVIVFLFVNKSRKRFYSYFQVKRLDIKIIDYLVAA